MFPALARAEAPLTCQKPLYLTFDTGHMAVAPLIADVLRRQQVRATFFAAQERTQEGDGSLGEHWAAWWRERAAEGHEFASHTWDHVVWKADLPGEPQRFRVVASGGGQAGRPQVWTGERYCADIGRSAQRLKDLIGRTPLPLFRAPAGRTSDRLLDAARRCGYRHVGWSAAGFLGDELPSERASNAQLLEQALRNIRSGDILMAHLGIWSRRDPWAPAVLEPLLVGLRQRGFCFATLREHPEYREWIRARSG
ncbi:MAG: polysaccharide deacetylase family protein [Rhodoferax sp.]|nr:polysaccharide deacetylase family protein [Rhodoferax sp.]